MDVKRRLKLFLDCATYADRCDDSLHAKTKDLAIEEARRLMKKTSYINACKTWTYNDKTILNCAILEGLETLPYLLLRYMDVDPSSSKYDSVGRSSIHYVCQAGDLKLLKKFIVTKHYNIQFNAKDRAGLIPLHLAILYGQTKIAYKMLKRLAVVENDDMFFGRSIHAAAYMDQLTVVQRIHAKFPEQATIVTSGFCTPPVCALFGDSTHCLEYLWRVSPLMADRIMSKAVSFTESEVTALNRVTFLLDNMADPNGFDEELCEEPAVIVAAKKRWTEVLEVLVQRTEAIDGVNMTAQGIIDYIETPDFILRDAQRVLTKLQTLKGRMIQELDNRNVLAAKILCLSLKSDVNEIMYDRLQNLCNFYWGLAISSRIWMKASVEELLPYTMTLYRDGSYGTAILAIDGCLALDPEDAACVLMREEIVKKMAGE